MQSATPHPVISSPAAERWAKACPDIARRPVARLFANLDTPRRVVNNLVANQAKSVAIAVDERSLNLQLFANVEDNGLHLYSAARNGYLQRRQKTIVLAAEDDDWQWAWALPSPAADRLPRTASAGRRENPT
jgi:ABC-type transporter lipoprotein component MlaA